MQRKIGTLLAIFYFWLLIVGNGALAQREENPDVQRARQYIRTAFRITTISDKTLNIALGDKYKGIPWLKWIGLLISADQIYEEFTIGDYYRGIYLAIQTGFDKVLVEALEFVGFSGVAKTARLAFSPIERSLLEFYDAAVAIAIQNQIKLYFEARRLGYSHGEILNKESRDEELLFTDDGWLYIAGDVTFSPYSAVRPGHNKREEIYALARDAYEVGESQNQYNKEKESLGEAFLEMILGMTKETGSADLALVIDRSGSMSYPLDHRTRLDAAKLAAMAFADFVWPEDYLAIVDFAGDVAVPDQGYFEDSEEIKAVINNIEVEEWNGTAIGLALYACFEGFKTLSHPNNQLILLLTDGANNKNPDPLDIIPENSCPVFVIGFGGGEEYNEPILKEIAEATGGMYKHVDFDSLEELSDFFASIGGLMHGASTILKQRGFVNTGQKIEHSFELAKDTGLVHVNLGWGGSTLGAEIIGPEGDFFLPERIGEIYLGFDLLEPILGQYRIQITGEEVEPGGEPYILSVAAVSPIIANFHPFKPLYALEEKIEIKVEVKQKGGDYSFRELPCTVNIAIYDPQGLVQEQTGNICQYVPRIPGPYFIQADIRGSDFRGESFRKLLREQVWAGSREALTVNPNSLEPTPGSIVKTRNPLIAAQVLGPSSNLALEAWSLIVDNAKVDFDFDEINQYISWVSLEPLSAGKHDIILTVVDKEGQGPLPFSWSFQIKVNELAVSEDNLEKGKEDSEQESTPRVFQAINFPNPFQGETNFAIWLEKGSEVEIKIFNLSGQEIAYLTFFGERGYNEVLWQARNKTDESLKSGIYFYVIQAKELTLHRKMLLLE